MKATYGLLLLFGAKLNGQVGYSSPSDALWRSWSSSEGRIVFIGSAFYIYGLVQDWHTLLLAAEEQRSIFLAETLDRSIALAKRRPYRPGSDLEHVLHVLSIASYLLKCDHFEEAAVLKFDPSVAQEIKEVMGGAKCWLRHSPRAYAVDWGTVGRVPIMYTARDLSDGRTGRLFLANQYLATYLAAWPLACVDAVRELQLDAESAGDELRWRRCAQGYRELFGSDSDSGIVGVVRGLERIVALPIIDAHSLRDPQAAYAELSILACGERDGLFNRVALLGRSYPEKVPECLLGEVEDWRRLWAENAMYAFVGAREVVCATQSAHPPQGIRVPECDVFVEPVGDVLASIRSLYNRMADINKLLGLGGGSAVHPVYEARIGLVQDAIHIVEAQNAGAIDRSGASERLREFAFLSCWNPEDVTAVSCGLAELRRSDFHAYDYPFRFQGDRHVGSGVSLRVEYRVPQGEGEWHRFGR